MLDHRSLAGLVLVAVAAIACGESAPTASVQAGLTPPSAVPQGQGGQKQEPAEKAPAQTKKKNQKKKNKKRRKGGKKGGGKKGGGKKGGQKGAAKSPPKGKATPRKQQAPPPGVWHRPTRQLPEAGGVLDDEQAKSVEELANLPYMSGFRSAEARAMISSYDADLAFDGLNLLVSSHAPEARLIDMQGETVHTWSCAFEDAWPPTPERPAPKHMPCWRRVHVFPNGDLLTIFEGRGMVKLDRDSKILWRQRALFHHDLSVTDDGKIYTLELHPLDQHPAAEFAIPRVVDDTITVLDRDGKILRRVSVFDAFANSLYRAVIPRPVDNRDLFHTNTIEVLVGRFAERAPWLKKGNVLISARNLSTIAVVDLAAQRVVWAMQGGMWFRQHQPTFLDNGNLLLFDNLGAPSPRGKRGSASQVLEFDPLTKHVVWLYRGSADNFFLCPILGSCQRLANGNTLITDSTNGRALEVTAKGETVWEYNTPHRAGENGELVASMPEMIRLRREDLPFLDR